MENLSNEQQITHNNAEYCHICTKVLSKKKNQVKKYVIMITTQANIEDLHI